MQAKSALGDLSVGGGGMVEKQLYFKLSRLAVSLDRFWQLLNLPW